MSILSNMNQCVHFLSNNRRWFPNLSYFQYDALPLLLLLKCKVLALMKVFYAHLLLNCWLQFFFFTGHLNYLKCFLQPYLLLCLEKKLHPPQNEMKNEIQSEPRYQKISYVILTFDLNQSWRSVKSSSSWNVTIYNFSIASRDSY